MSGVPVTGTLVPAGSFPVANASDIYGLAAFINTNGASGLQNATTIVTTSAAVAPTEGQVLTATSSTTAIWSTPSTTAYGLRTLTTTVNVSAAAAPAVDQALVATGSAAATWSYPIAYQLKTASGVVSISSATAPTAGYQLIATSATTATWQLPSVVYYGDSSDGDVTVSADITLTRDMHYHNLTIQNSGSITTDGFRIYVSGTLDISACTSAARILVGASGGQRRKDGGIGATTTAPGLYKLGSRTGENSTGFGGAGGSAGSGGSAGGRAFPLIYRNIQAICNWVDLSGAGGGGGDCTISDYYSGGTGGFGCSGIFIAAAQLTRSSSNAAGTIVSTGGNGANGTVDSSQTGSGGGGGGGAVVLVVGALSGTSATSLLQSVGGAGSTYGVDSNGGYGGTCVLVVVGTSETSAGPTANSTTTGGTTSLTV